MRCRAASASAVVLALLACERSQPPSPIGADATSVQPVVVSGDTQLSASPTGGKDVTLAWKTESRDERAWFVEFNIGDESDFSILTILPPQAMSFVHADIAAGTRFNYRVRPAIGAASGVVNITTAQPTDASPGIQQEGPLEEMPGGGAAVGELAAILSSPTSIDLRWNERCAEEDGYLVEVSASPDSGFAVCALLPPNATSFRKANLPPLTTCYFRVRAFAHGPPSNVASAMGASASSRPAR
jgi:hypothetical protein